MADSQDSTSPVCLFYSYAHEDDGLRQQLDDHLSHLRRSGFVRVWHDRAIGPGREWRPEIADALGRADIILLLISPSFMASDYCCDVEAKIAMERHESGRSRTIPVILRPVDGWQSAPFGSLQACPQDGRPVTTWPQADEAFAEVARTIGLPWKSGDRK